MATVNDKTKVSTARGPSPARPLGPSQNVPKPPAAPQPPVGPRPPAVRQDEKLIAARPQTDIERQKAILEAVRAAQAAASQDVAPEKSVSDKPVADKPVADKPEPEVSNGAPKTKVVADAVGLADGVRESMRIATSADELARLPGVGKAVQSGSRLGRIFDAIPESKVGKAIATAMQHNKVLAPASRFLGRIAPLAGVVVAGFDIHSAVKVNQDPKASTKEKVLANAKAGLSAVAGAAGVAALALAPTGIGAAIAGGIALGAGLLSLGADLWLGHAKKERTEAEAKAGG